MPSLDLHACAAALGRERADAAEAEPPLAANPSPLPAVEHVGLQDLVPVPRQVPRVPVAAVVLGRAPQRARPGTGGGRRRGEHHALELVPSDLELLLSRHVDHEPGRDVSAVASAGHEVQPPSGTERQLGALALEHDQRIQMTEAHAGADLHGEVGVDLVPGDAVAAELDGPGRALATVSPEPGEVVLLGNLLEPPRGRRPSSPGSGPSG